MDAVDEERFRSCIAFALAKLTVPRSRRERDEDWRRRAGAAIAAHLKLSNWRIEPGPVAPGHATPAPMVSTKNVETR
jgi:hypothetical protein